MSKREQIVQKGGVVVFFIVFTLWLLLVFWFTMGVLGWIH